MSGEPGTTCSCCKTAYLILVRGTVVCPKCDCVENWPKGRGD